MGAGRTILKLFIFFILILGALVGLPYPYSFIFILVGIISYYVINKRYSHNITKSDSGRLKNTVPDKRQTCHTCGQIIINGSKKNDKKIQLSTKVQKNYAKNNDNPNCDGLCLRYRISPRTQGDKKYCSLCKVHLMIDGVLCPCCGANLRCNGITLQSEKDKDGIW